MPLPPTTGGYALGPDDGEALWFNGGTGLLKATADQTEGRYAAYELRIPRGFGPPLHVHANEDEFFLVLSGEVHLQHGDDVVEGVPGSLAYTPRGVAHSFGSTPRRPGSCSSSARPGSRRSSARWAHRPSG